MDPLAFDSLVPACQENNVAVIARCVLDEGGLTGLLTPETTFEEKDFRSDYFEAGPLTEYVKRVEALEQFVPEHADSIVELAIKFALYHPGITTANISLHIKEHADQNEVLSNVVDGKRAHPTNSGCLLHLAVDEWDTLDDLGDELVAVESVPVFLRIGGQFEDHAKGGYA